MDPSPWASCGSSQEEMGCPQRPDSTGQEKKPGLHFISCQGFNVVVLMIIKVILATWKEFTGREQEEKQGGHIQDCDLPPKVMLLR